MAVVTVCDICRREIGDTDGSEITYSDWNYVTSIADFPVYKKRKIKMRICDICVENIRNYCRDYRED